MQMYFDGRKCNSNQKWNNNKCRCEYKTPREHHACEKNCTWNPSASSGKNGEYMASITEDSVIT